jgi:ubiquinone/menaquinone biosynthesis C-methylase UbiE
MEITPRNTEKIEGKTGQIYDHLFTAYSQRQFDESVELFFMRHKKWDIPLEWFKDKMCLDAGCGGGRFVIALAKSGAKKVYGIDISKAAIVAARERARERGLSGVTEFTNASVLALPFPDAQFDYVVCSGVILLTEDPHKAFTELVRVLKPGGKLFLSVYGKGGLKWMTNDLFRYTFCKVIPFRALERLFALLGVPANKRYNILDNLYVDYAFRFNEEEIRQWLQDKNFWNYRRLKFERYDYSTIISRLIHGEGWIQVYADKKS